jgi:hypothetical protein
MEKEICSKIQKFRKEILKEDWKPDSSYTRPGPRGMPLVINYVSINKIKRNTAPIHAELGLDLKINMDEVIDIPNNGGVRGKFTFILTDLDSCQTDETTVYSSAPSSDKGESVSISNAIRIFYSSRFGIVDGIEFDEHDDVSEMKSALSEKAIPPAESVPAPAPVSAPAPVPEPVKTPVQQTLQDKPEVKAETKTESGPVIKTAPKTEKPAESTLTPIEERACNNAIRKIESLKVNLKDEDYNRAYEIYGERKTTADVTALLTILRKAESGMKPAVEGM